MMLISSTSRDFFFCYWCTAKIIAKNAVWCPIDKDSQPKYYTYWSKIVVKDYRLGDCTYIVDYPFCSFECCLAHIKENSWNYRYARSRRLLMEIFRELIGRDAPEPCCATHRSRLAVFGGDLELSEFRKRFKKKYYEVERAVAIRPAQIEYGLVGKIAHDSQFALAGSQIVQRT